MKGRGAFTLIELLVVLIIMGVLIAVGAPVYLSVIEKARASEALDIIASVKQAELRYMQQNAAGLFVSIYATAPVDSFPGNNQLDIGWNTRYWNFQVTNGVAGYCNIIANRKSATGAATTTNIMFSMNNTNFAGRFTGDHSGTPNI